MSERGFYLWHDDDAGFDEVRIRTIPRYKTSGLSGDEWRTSVKIELLRKGRILVEDTVGNLTAAAARLPWLILRASEDGNWSTDRSLCFQPGCSAPAVAEYRLKARFCHSGHRYDPPSGDTLRCFCRRHLRRGDCGLEDADANYEVVSGPGPDKAAGYGDDISESEVIFVRAPQDGEGGTDE